MVTGRDDCYGFFACGNDFGGSEIPTEVITCFLVTIATTIATTSGTATTPPKILPPSDRPDDGDHEYGLWIFQLKARRNGAIPTWEAIDEHTVLPSQQ